MLEYCLPLCNIKVFRQAGIFHGAGGRQKGKIYMYREH